jgi:hypothetical protein
MDKCIIVATGWSLKDFDFSKLKGDIIAVNGAAMYCQSEYVACIDIELVHLKSSLLDISNSFEDKKVITDHMPKITLPYDLTIMQVVGVEGFETRANMVRNGGNSGYMAINAAYHLGAREVYLLGFDLSSGRKGEKYFYDYVNPEGVHPNYLHMQYYYDTMIRELPDDFKVYNCSKVSSLRGFDYKDICEIL